MSKPNDGGPAFPEMKSAYQLQGGMSLRDWFAGKALGHIPALLDVSEENASCENIAGHAYQIADAMLAARERKEEA